MNLSVSDPLRPWSGDGLLAKAFLAYARSIPAHPSKIRIFRALARRCFPRGLQVKNQDGVRISIDPVDFIGHAICFDGLFEPLSLSLARRLMRGGGIFLDIGANIGLFTCTMALIPGVKCIAVDASAHAFVKLLQNLNRNAGAAVTAVNAALSGCRAVVRLETPFEGDLGTTRVTVTTAREGEVLHYVPCLPLDELLLKAVSEPIELMKIDVEGYELQVFRGMNLSGCYRPKNIIMEYTERVASNRDDLLSCFRLLSNSDYEPFTVAGESFDPAKPLPEENLWWRSR